MSGEPVNLATYNPNTTSTSHTITFGWTPAAGSLLVACFGTNQTVTMPAGWTQVGTFQPVIFWKRSDGTETSLAITIGASENISAAVLNYAAAWRVRGAVQSSGAGPLSVSFSNSADETNVMLAWASGGSAFTANSETNGYTEIANLTSTGGSFRQSLAVATVLATSNNQGTSVTGTGTTIIAQGLTLTTSVVNPKFICGAECGIAGVGTASAGTEHWSTFQAGVSVVTSGPSLMRSTRCFKLNMASATACVHAFASAIASPATGALRAYIYFESLPTASTELVMFSGATSGAGWGAYFNSADSKVYAGRATGSLGATGITVTTGVWYRLDVKVVFAATHTADVSVDGTACGQVSQAVAAEACSQWQMGSSSISNGVIYMDDIIVSGTSADYPIGDGTVVGLYPSGDRTNTAAAGSDGTPNGTYHFFSTAGDFAKGTSGATNTGAQDAESTAWQSLDNPLTTTAGGSWLAALTAVSTERLVFTMDDLPADASTVNGVMCVVTSHSAAATANLFALDAVYLSDGQLVNFDSLLLNIDLSESTITVPCSILRPFSMTWPVSGSRGVNDLLMRFRGSSDVNPDPYLDGVCLEVDYVPLVAALPVKLDPYRQLLNH